MDKKTSSFLQNKSGLLVFASAFLFYFYHMSPTIGFGDTAILIDNIQKEAFNTEVNTHPFTIVVGKLFMLLPWQDLAFRANLISVVAGALALAVFFQTIFILHNNHLIAVLATLALGLSHSFFWHSTIVENYQVSSIITAFSLFCYVKLHNTHNENWLYLLFALFGLGLFNHVQMGFMGMGIGLAFLQRFAKANTRLPLFLKSLAGFCVGMLPWMFLFIRDVSRSGGNFSLVLKNAFQGSFGNIFFSQNLFVAVTDFIIIYFFQFPGLFFFIPLIGIWKFYPNRHLLFPFAGAFLHLFSNTFFFMFYGTWDKFAFLLQSFIILVFFSSFVLNFLLKSSRSLFIATPLFLSLLATPLFYDFVENSAQNPDGFWYPRYNNIYSHNLYDQAGFIINPAKHEFYEMENFCDLVFEKLPQGSVMLDDDSRSYYPLADYYQKYYNKRRDIQILLMNSWGIAGWGMSSEQLVMEIKDTVKRGTPFFIPTLMAPYQSIIDTLTQDNEFYFEKFPLNDKRWLYQVKSKKEHPYTRKTRPGLWDLQFKDISSSKDSSPVRQFMQSYGDNWDSHDQIFVSGLPDAFIEFRLKHNQSNNATIKINLTKAPDFAIVAISFNGKNIASVDLYSRTVSRFSTDPLPVLLEQGENKIKFTIMEKNSSSTGYKFGIDSVEIKN